MSDTSKRTNDALEEAIIHFYQTEPPATMEQSWRDALRSEEEAQMNESKSKMPVFRMVTAMAATLVLVVGSLWAGQLDMESQGVVPMQPEMMADSAMMMSGGSEGSYRTAEKSAVGNGSVSTMPSDQKLVRTANIHLSTAEFELVSEEITALIESTGGYNENISQYSGDGMGTVRSINWCSRIPSDQLDAFLLEISSFAKVTSQSENTQDQTLQFYDNEARIAILEQKKARLQEMLSQAQSVTEMIEIESAIADTQYELDSIQTWQTTITRDVDMSAVYITLDETANVTTANASDEPLLKRIQAGFLTSMQWFADFFQNMVVFVVMALPVLIVGIVLLVIGRVMWKKRH